MRRPPTKLDVQAVFFGSHIGTWIYEKFTWILHKFIGFCWGICMAKPIVSSFGFSSSVLTCLRFDKLPKSGWILWSLSSHWGTTTAIPSLKAGAWLLRPRWWPFFQHQPIKYTTHFFRICRCWAPFFPLTNPWYVSTNFTGWIQRLTKWEPIKPMGRNFQSSSEPQSLNCLFFENKLLPTCEKLPYILFWSSNAGSKIWVHFCLISIGCLSELSELSHRNIPSSHLKNREWKTRFLSYAVFQFHWADADLLTEIYKQLRILPETSSQKALENGWFQD